MHVSLNDVADRVSALLTWGEVALKERDAIANELRIIASHRSGLVDRLLHEATNLGGSQSHVGCLLQEAATQLRTAASEGGASVHRLPPPDAVEYPDSGFRTDKNALALWAAHMYDTGGTPYWGADAMHSLAARAKAEAQPPEVARDAGRLDWLESWIPSIAGGPRNFNWKCDPRKPYGQPNGSLRAAIDAAISGAAGVG